MKRTGSADLPLHYGHVPLWLAERMGKLGLAITEEIISSGGKNEFLERMSNPFWFQSFGAVMGMDWHSSGITTSVMGALKKSINPHTKEFGIYICGGKGKLSRQTPIELTKFSELHGLNNMDLVKNSKLSAKVDNTAIQDGFQLYQHNFIVSDEGNWTVVQQGMNNQNSTARRYHWYSKSLKSFTEEPHTFIYGQNQGNILNLTDRKAKPLKHSMLSLASEAPAKMINEINKLTMPNHHDVRTKDVDIKRLGAILWLAQDKNISNFDELLLLEGLGPMTLQSLALVSEIIYGSPARFKDPARFSFANGGKDGHPFPVPVNVYDETIKTLQNAIHRAKLGNSDKIAAVRSLSVITQKIEKDFIPNANLQELIQQERASSWKYGGRTVFGKAKPPIEKQLNLFSWLNYDHLSIKDAKTMQEGFRKQLKFEIPDHSEIKTIAGADISYNKDSTLMFGAIVILHYPSLKLKSYALATAETNFPYKPGYLGFREVPTLLKVWEKVVEKPDVVVLDGQGFLHPRRMGVASHFGVLTGSSTIGCAKTSLYGFFEEPGILKRSYSYVYENESKEHIGYAVRTKDNTHPVYVSPGYGLSFTKSLEIMKNCIGNYRIPEPTRIAHEIVNEFRIGKLQIGYHEVEPTLTLF